MHSRLHTQTGGGKLCTWQEVSAVASAIAIQFPYEVSFSRRK